MSSHVKTRDSGRDDTSVRVLDDMPQEPRTDYGKSPGAATSGNRQESQRSGSESATTAAEDNPVATRMDSMDKIETASPDDRQVADDHNVTFADTIKGATHSAKKKLYIHSRHNRRTSRQLTPGTMSKHLGHSKATRDPESQAENEDDEAKSATFAQNLRIIFTTFPYWNMAFWSGWCYSIGSAMFVIDGAWAWVPLVWPETEFEGQSEYGVPLWFFFGACLYQVGGVMAYLEAINDGSFAGAAMKRLLEGHQDIEKELLDAKLHTFFGHLVPHHHHDDDDDDKEGHENDQNTQPDEKDTDASWKAITESRSPEELYTETKQRVERRSGVDEGVPKEGQVKEYITWRWWPTQHALLTYHIFELGYVACAIQLFGVTLYGVTSVVVLPGILENLEHWQTLAAYWIPQVIASCCFLIASIMFTLMAQDKWYKPKYNTVSWWIGIWAQIGSVGFLMCACFGLHSEEHSWAEYQSTLSSTWGSFFYMLSGLFQWYEAININVGPVLAFPNNRTPVLLRRQKS